MEIKKNLKDFWDFLKKDSWPSFFVSLILILIIIKFIFFPALNFATGTELPLVIVESCSMYHSEDLEEILNDKAYSDLGLSFENTSDWVLKNGFTKGDIIFVVGPSDLEIGDVIIFNSGFGGTPIIHRIVAFNEDGTIVTKGDHNPGFLPFETSIEEKQIIGKSVLKIPFIGWVKLIFFDVFKDQSQRGFCR